MSKTERRLFQVVTNTVPTSWSQDTLYFVTLGNPAQTDPTQADYPHVEVYITDETGAHTQLTNNQLIDARYLAYVTG